MNGHASEFTEGRAKQEQVAPDAADVNGHAEPVPSSSGHEPLRARQAPSAIDRRPGSSPTRYDPDHHEREWYALRQGRDRADARIEAETAVGLPYGEPVAADAWERPPGEIYRFDGATLVNGRVGVIAQKKVGKTTLMQSVIGSYLGVPLDCWGSTRWPCTSKGARF